MDMEVMIAAHSGTLLHDLRVLLKRRVSFLRACLKRKNIFHPQRR
jgi:hypothetical protein